MTKNNSSSKPTRFSRPASRYLNTDYTIYGFNDIDINIEIIDHLYRHEYIMSMYSKEMIGQSQYQVHTLLVTTLLSYMGRLKI